MQRFDRRALAGVAVTAFALGACSDEPMAPAVAAPATATFAVGADEAVGVSSYFANVNRAAAASGIVMTRAELQLTSDAPVKTPILVFANDRTLRLDTKWVAHDPRRLSTDATLSYAVYSPLARATVGGPAEAAFDASFATWNSVSCSKVAVHKKALAPGQVPSFIVTGLFPPADINDIGFLPGSFFELVFGPGSSQATIAVTVTFSFIQTLPNGQPVLDKDGNVIPTDIDGDGRFDTAFKEVWFNDALPYSTTGAAGRVDIESAVLHEHGHALELGHFGKITGDPKTGKLHVSPTAVMNAINLGVLRTPLGTDNAALCSNFAFWK